MTPVGVAVFSLCHAYGVAELFAARAVVVSTLLWLVGAMAWGLTSWAHVG
jgi:predicted permease